MMRAMNLREIGAALGLSGPAPDICFEGVSTDTRTLQPGELFVALTGERFDGHAFLEQARECGAVAALVARASSSQLPQLEVGDTLRALGELARLNRSQFGGIVVGLTGSTGKTSTKEMIAAIFRQRGSVMATRGNLNNEIGVPLTLLRLEPGIRFAVIEMGAGRRGDIRYLADIARADIALVTNVMPAHLEGFGSVEVVAETKGEIYECLVSGGTAVLNIDEPFASRWIETIGERHLVRASAKGRIEADVRASEVVCHDDGSEFVLRIHGTPTAVCLPLPGLHQVSNAVNAAAVAVAAGVDAAAIRDGLQSLRPLPGRMERLRGVNGCELINDTYNANPGSVRAAIDALARFAGQRVLVMGTMAELGDASAKLHFEVGAYARERGVDRLLVTGAFAEALARGFGVEAEVFGSQAELTERCRELDRPGVVVLVKGSRSAAMERVVQALAGTSDAPLGAEVH